MCMCFLMCKSSLNYLNGSGHPLIDILKRIRYWQSNVFILFESV